MALNYVSLVFTEQDAGNSPSAGPVVIAPTATVVAAGQTVVSQAPVSRQLGGGTVSVSLVACDNTGTTPAAGFWAYSITLPGGQPGLYLINFANGATQQFSNLTPVVAQTTYGPAAGSGFANPMTTLGDLIYENATPAAARLAGDTSNVRKFLRTQSTAGVAQAPAWDTLIASDLAATANELGNAPLTLAPSGALQWGLPWQFPVEAYGAKGDGKIINDATIAGGALSTLTSATANFTAADTGKFIMVNGALGAAATPLITTITYVSATTVTLAAAATTAISGNSAIYGTDDTAAVNSAVTAAKAYALAGNYKAQVILGPKFYCLASGPTQTGNGTTLPTFNSQIPLPYAAANGTSQKLVIEFIGTGDASQCQYFDSTVPNLQGSCLVSMVKGPSSPDPTYGSQSVVGGPTGAAGFTGGFANVKPVLIGVMVVQPVLTQQIALDFRYCAGYWWDKSSCQMFAAPAGNSPKLPDLPGLAFFQSTNSVGLYAPLATNNDDCGFGTVAVEGFNIGVAASEHFTGQRLAVIYANTGLYVTLSGGTVIHGIEIGYFSCEQANAVIHSNGGGGTQIPLNIGLMDVEIINTADVQDPSNTLTGVIHWADFARSAPTITGAASLKIINDRLGPGVWSGAPAAPGTGVAQQNTAWRDATVYVTSTAAITAVAVDGTSVFSGSVATGVPVPVRVPAGHTYTVTSAGGTLTTHWVLD